MYQQNCDFIVKEFTSNQMVYVVSSEIEGQSLPTKCVVRRVCVEKCV